MKKWIVRHTPTWKAHGMRRALLMCIAMTYLFVGFAHSFTHSAEHFDATIAASEASAPQGDNSDDGDTKQLSVAEHCYVCAPVIIPTFAAGCGPSFRPMRVAFGTPRLRVGDHRRLDTPPPKQMT